MKSERKVFRYCYDNFGGYEMKPFDTSLLYVLSGTGNTYRVAKWIETYYEKKEIKTTLTFIEHADLKEDFKNSERQLTAVLFPTHGFMPPWSMIKFLFKMPRQQNAKILSVATRGALWFGPVKIPGAAGDGKREKRRIDYLPVDIMKLRGRMVL